MNNLVSTALVAVVMMFTVQSSVVNPEVCESPAHIPGADFCTQECAPPTAPGECTETPYYMYPWYSHENCPVHG